MTLVTIHRDDVAYSLWTGRLSPRGTSPRVGAEMSSKWTNWSVVILVGTMATFMYLTRPNQEVDK